LWIDHPINWGLYKMTSTIPARKELNIHLQQLFFFYLSSSFWKRLWCIIFIILILIVFSFSFWFIKTNEPSFSKEIKRTVKESDWLCKVQATGCPKKHGNSVTNLKSHNIIISARVYFMKRVEDCKDVSLMSPQDEQWKRTSLLCLHTTIFFFY